MSRQNGYPRALPYRPPEGVSAAPASVLPPPPRPAPSTPASPDRRPVLATVPGMSTAAARQLDRVAAEPLGDDEKKALAQARRIGALLRTQTRELQGYWDTGAKEHATRFHQAREQTWAGIKSLLDI